MPNISWISTLAATSARLFFAPLLGAVNGAAAEVKKARGDAHAAFERGHISGVARADFQLFIAPLSGAIRGAVHATQKEHARLAGRWT